jgi:hypothetical protein
VFIWRGSPAAWTERAQQVATARLRAPTPDELAKLRRLGPGTSVMTVTTADHETFDVAASAERADALLGPFGLRRAGVGTGHHPG